MSYDSEANYPAGGSGSDGSDQIPGSPPPYSSHDDPGGTRIIPPPGYVPSGPGGWPPPPPPGYGPSTYPPAGGGYGAYTPPPPGYGPPPSYVYPQSSYAGGSGTRVDGIAIAAFVVSICSFVVCPLIPSIVALCMIPGSRRTINSSGGTITGLGFLTAAKIISWSYIGLLVVGVIVIAIVASSGSSSNSLAHLVTM